MGVQTGVGVHSGFGVHSGLGVHSGFGVHSGLGVHSGFGVHSGLGVHSGFGVHSGLGVHSGFTGVWKFHQSNPPQYDDSILTESEYSDTNSRSSAFVSVLPAK